MASSREVSAEVPLVYPSLASILPTENGLIAGLHSPGNINDLFTENAHEPKLRHRIITFTANPEEYVAYVSRGVALSLRSKLQEGLAEVERAIPLEPEWEDAYFWKGMLCAYLGRSLVAMEAFEKALEVGLPPLLLTPLYWLEKDRPNFFSNYAAPLLARYNV